MLAAIHGRPAMCVPPSTCSYACSLLPAMPRPRRAAACRVPGSPATRLTSRWCLRSRTVITRLMRRRSRPRPTSTRCSTRRLLHNTGWQSEHFTGPRHHAARCQEAAAWSVVAGVVKVGGLPRVPVARHTDAQDGVLEGEGDLHQARRGERRQHRPRPGGVPHQEHRGDEDQGTAHRGPGWAAGRVRPSRRRVAQDLVGVHADAMREGVGHAIVGMLGRNLVLAVGQQKQASTVAGKREEQKLLLPRHGDVARNSPS